MKYVVTRVVLFVGGRNDTKVQKWDCILELEEPQDGIVGEK